MNQRKQKLELTWIGKEVRPKLEPRILLEDPTRSYVAATRVTNNDIFDNRLIFGDNLLALKALEAEFTGNVKCIYIDPPFNTGEMFEHYDDGLEHSTWLSQMRDRLELLRRLLTIDGTLFVHLDDNELGYMIVLLDELFGRDNRLYTITFRQGSATGHKAINPGCVSTTNFVLIYARDKAAWKPNRIFTARQRDTRYGQFILNVDDHFSKWNIVTLTRAYADSLGLAETAARKIIREDPEKLDDFVLEHPRNVIRTARPDYKGVGVSARKVIDTSKSQPQAILKLERDDHSDMYFKNGERILFYSDKLKLIDGTYVAGEPLTTLWDDILSNNLHNEGGVSFPKGKKPEFLLKRVIELSTSPGDLVLDSFAGSGTTGAVAHKMGRRWIMVELGEHCHTHVVPRMTRVIDGQDSSGVTVATGWKGGGGFRYFKLAPSLLMQDRWGQWIISKEYNATMLAEALCKLEGFRYEPSDSIFWMQGRSTETDFLYCTTQTLSTEQLNQLSEEVGDSRTLLVLCSAFRGKADRWPNLTVKKIPKAVLHKCEWGHDDYSLKVENLPKPPKKPRTTLFDDIEGGDE